MAVDSSVTGNRHFFYRKSDKLSSARHYSSYILTFCIFNLVGVLYTSQLTPITFDESTYYCPALAGDECEIFITGDDIRGFFIRAYKFSVLVSGGFGNQRD